MFNRPMLQLVSMVLLLGAVQALSVDLTLITVPTGKRVDVPLGAGSQVEIRREETLSRLRVRIENAQSLLSLDPRMRAYVVWAVTPEGEFENLGELEIDGRRAELETTTALQRFGILVTAEPHFMVPAPGNLVPFRSGTPRDDDIRVERFTAEVGPYDYSEISLPPQGNLPARITQARMAYQVAEASGASEFAPAELRSARISLDSMEELLRRNTPTDVLTPYVNDSIRLSARAERLTRSRRVEGELEDTTQQLRLLEQQNTQIEQELERLNRRSAQREALLSDLQAQLERNRSTNRDLELNAEESERRIRSLEGEVARLSDPWLGLRNALVRSVGARETARGLSVTLPESYFVRNQAELAGQAREFLSRIAGILSVDNPLDIRIEGHVNTGPASRNLALSEARAEAVRSYLVSEGLDEEDILAEGFGATRPIIPDDVAEGQAVNDRVEILFRGLRER